MLAALISTLALIAGDFSCCSLQPSTLTLDIDLTATHTLYFNVDHDVFYLCERVKIYAQMILTVSSIANVKSVHLPCQGCL